MSPIWRLTIRLLLIWELGTEKTRITSQVQLDMIEQKNDRLVINDLRKNAEICESNEIEIHNLKIFYNNIQGFKNKRLNILHSEIVKDYDILVFQETMISDLCSTKYEDFSLVDKLAKITHFRDSSYFSQGSMFVWDPAKVQGSQVSIPQAQGFEISAMKFSSKYDHMTIISAYRSQSLNEKDGNVPEYFTALADSIAAIEGKILVIGDLNLVKGRKIAHR